MAGDTKTLDPKAALENYKYPEAADDQKAIDKVENAIKARFPGSVTDGKAEGVDADVSAKQAGVDEEEAKEQEKKAQEAAEKERREHPDEVAKEAKESPPGPLHQGAPVKPSVKAPAVAPANAPPAPKKAGGGGDEHAKPHGGGGKHGGAATEAKVGAPPTGIVLVGADKTDFDGYLNAYPSKSPETKEKISKIKEMAGIAKGFDKQVESIVPKDGDHGTWFKEQLGKSELATFTDNPYAKVQGNLGTLMRVLSKTNAVVSMVGNVTGKLGMILTILGFVCMIFPPLGSAIEAIARVLNIIGLVCDGIGFAVSTALTACNGINLARQIGKGASNEEKAATADLMVSEATSAGGHFINLAMNYGPKFMKGFKNASKGVIGGLVKKVTSSIAKFGAKALGPAANWAKNIVFKTGLFTGPQSKFMTAVKSGAAKLGAGAEKVWKAPEVALDYLKDTKFARMVNESGAAKAIERFGAGVDRTVENSKILRGVEGTAAEAVGAKLGSVGESTRPAKWLDRSVQADEQKIKAALEHNAVKNAGNKEAGRIDKEIRKNRNKSMDKGWEGDLEGSKPLWAEADRLEASKAEKVAAAEQQTLEKRQAHEAQKDAAEQAAKNAEAAEAAEKKEFWEDPKKSQEKTKDKLAELDQKKEDLRYQEWQANAELNRADATPAEKKVAEEELKKIKHERRELRHERAEAQGIGIKAAGGEGVENIGGLKEKAGETWAALHGKDEKAEKQKEAVEEVAKDSGHADHEKFEKQELHEKVEELGGGEGGGEGWATPDLAPAGASAYVNSALDGLDADTGFDHDEDDQDSQDAQGADESKTQPDAPANDSAQASAPTVAPAPAPAPQPAADEGAKDTKEETGGELPELAYWPDLVKQDGEFEKSAKDLLHMKQIAYAFQKQQAEAKKKALEQFSAMCSVEEYNAAKAKHAAEHKKSMQPGADEQKQSATAANEGAGALGTAVSKQNESKGHANGEAQPAPDPGSKPSVLHPIRRIWWYVKRWAAKTAAKVFGYIQEKISSLIMKMICGVSMDDMKAYTLALHRHSQWSALIASGKGPDAATTAMTASDEGSKKSKSAAEEAMSDASECDQNIADAATFVANVEQSEKDLAAEQQKAVQFIASLKAAVAAEKERKAAEQAKKDAENQKQAFGGLAAPKEAPNASASPAPKNMSVAPTKKLASEKKKKPVSAASVSKVKSAADYVSKQATIVTQQLVSSKESQAHQLTEKLEKAGKKGLVQDVINQLATHTGSEIVAGMKTAADGIKNDATAAAQQSMSDNAELQGVAGQIKKHAQILDDASTQAFQKLNETFKSTYETATRAA